MSLPLVRSSAAAAVGRTMQSWRRLLRDDLLHRRPISSTAKEEPIYADELKMTKKIFKELEELEMKLQREIVEDIEKVKRMESEDRNSLNRLLTSRGMPKGEFRDKLIFGCNVAAVFLASSAVGTWNADRHVELARNASV